MFASNVKSESSLGEDFEGLDHHLEQGVKVLAPVAPVDQHPHPFICHQTHLCHEAKQEISENLAQNESEFHDINMLVAPLI